ncbi:MAG: ATP-binding protein, partial [Dehalococcoidia bacterium]|nr:ATP-binding protein [Dehalococcoidia bacterium]
QKADELKDLIDKLLQTTKIEGGAIRLDKEPVVLARVVQKVLKDNAFRSPKHELVFDFPLDIPIVEADLRYLEQILHNLVQNAIKYSPAGGKIMVSGRKENGDVVVSVQDQGVGVARDQLDKIFDRFYRVDNKLSRRVSGTGLGLSIAKGLVEAHGGRIWVESKPEIGSTFHFSLPASNEDNSDTSESGDA